MELKIMEWDHPLSYFQWSASLWSSSEFRKFSTGLQKQNNSLFNQAPLSTCFCNENSNTLHQPHSQPFASDHTTSSLDGTSWCSYALLSQLGNEYFQFPNPSPFSHFRSGAQHWNPPNHPADLHLPQSPALSHCLPISLAGISFPCIPLSLLGFFWSIPYFASSTSPRLSEPFLQTCLKGFLGSIPPATPIISCASCLQARFPTWVIQLQTVPFSRQNRCLWAKSWADMHQLGSPDFRGRLQTQSSWAAHRQLRLRGWL